MELVVLHVTTVLYCRCRHACDKYMHQCMSISSLGSRKGEISFYLMGMGEKCEVGMDRFGIDVEVGGGIP